MNAPTEDVFNLVCEYQQTYTNITWLKSDTNVKFKAVRGLIDYYNPKIFVYCEEDIILPPDVRKNYPFWLQQFAEIADKDGLACWRTNNHPKIFSSPDSKLNLCYQKPTFDYRWDINYGPSFYYAGHLMAFKSSLYLSVDKTLTQSPAIDCHLCRAARFEASPTSYAYHIGFNNCMDYKSYYKNTPEFQGIFSVTDNEGKSHSMRAK